MYLHLCIDGPKAQYLKYKNFHIIHKAYVGLPIPEKKSKSFNTSFYLEFLMQPVKR